MRAVNTIPSFAPVRTSRFAAGEVVRETRSAHSSDGLCGMSPAPPPKTARGLPPAPSTTRRSDRFATGIIVSQLVTDFDARATLVQGRCGADAQNRTSSRRAEVLLRSIARTQCARRPGRVESRAADRRGAPAGLESGRYPRRQRRSRASMRVSRRSICRRRNCAAGARRPTMSAAFAHSQQQSGQRNRDLRAPG